MLADYHLHTQYSDDSIEPMENMVKKAVESKFEDICFTDHVDYGIKYDKQEYAKLPLEKQIDAKKLCNVDYENYMKSLEALQQAYQAKIKIKKGLEFGVQMHTIERFEKLFQTYDFDFIIMSCHQVDDQEFWTHEFQKGRTQDDYVARYYQAIYDCVCAYKNYSVLGHLDMIQRYTSPRYPFEKSKEMITNILKRVIQDGKGIEVNTSSFHYNIPDLMPERSILKLYLELGGTILTVGSDAHEVGYMGDQIPFIYKELKDMGFKHICTFDHMVPTFHSL